MAGIRFLTTIAKSCHCTLFTEQNALQQVCESIVVPNLRVRADDEEVRATTPRCRRRQAAISFVRHVAPLRHGPLAAYADLLLARRCST